MSTGVDPPFIPMGPFSMLMLKLGFLAEPVMVEGKVRARDCAAGAIAPFLLEVTLKLVIGPPGGGKTRRLIEDLVELVKRGVSPYAILATTFSRQAAKEIENRFEGDIVVKTLHGAGLWIVRLVRQTRGEALPRVISEAKARSIAERAIQEVGAKFTDAEQVLDDMSRVRDLGAHAGSVHPQVREAMDRYTAILAAENLLDFTGIVEQARIELQDPDLQRFLSGYYVRVDELQDVNPLTEWAMLDVFRKAAREFVAFASPSQQIYGFRGANWERLCGRLPDEVEYEMMRENHRSTPEIVQAARRLAGPDADTMLATKSSIGEKVIAIEAQNPEMEADCVGRQVGRWIEQKIKLDEIAVLARTHAMLYPIQRALRAREIPFRLVGGGRDIFHREETQAVLGYLRLAQNPMNDDVLESIINFPPCGIGVKTRYKLRGEARMRWDHLFQTLAHGEKVRRQVVRRILQIFDLREQFERVMREEKPVMETVRRILELTGIPNYLNGEGDFLATHTISELVLASEEFDGLRDFIEHLQREVDKPRDANGVLLSTIHAAKGLQWDAVVIPGFQEGTLPMEGARLREERNLAFVGMTRPRFHLTLTSNRSLPPSQFLSVLPVQVAAWP